MGNLYLGNQKSVLNKGFMEIGEKDKPSDELLKVFPSEPITADSENYFKYNVGAGIEPFMAYEGDVAYMGQYDDSYIVLDKDVNTQKPNTKICIKFKEPVKAKVFSIKIGSSEWQLYATNDETAFRNTFGSYGWDETVGKYLVASGDMSADEMTDFEINPEKEAYKYYTFASSGSWANVYEIALKTE